LKRFLIFLFIFCILVLSSEQTKIDSLKQQLNSALQPEKVQILNDLSYYHLEKSPEISIDYAKKALNLAIILKDLAGQGNSEYYLALANENLNKFGVALNHYMELLEIQKKIGNKEDIASTLNYIGITFSNLSDYYMALEYYNKSKKVYRELSDSIGVATVSNNIGLVYESFSRFDKALYYQLHALRIYESIADKDGIATSLNNMGNIYQGLGDFNKALDFFRRTLDIYYELDDKYGLSMAYNNLGMVYHDLKEIDKAHDYYNKSLELEKEIKDPFGLAGSYNNLAIVYEDFNQPEKAEEYYLKSLEISKKIKDKYSIANTSNNIGHFYIKQKQFDKAFSYLENGRKISHDIGTKDLEKESFDGLAKFYAATNNYEKAYEFFNRFTELRDSIFATEKNQKIVHLQNKYEAEKTENLIDAMKKEQEIQNLIKKYLILGLILILLTTILLFYLYNEKKKEITLRKKAEKQLIESEESFRCLAENIKVAVFTFNEKGYFTYANPAASKISGYSNKEILTKKFFENVHPDFVELVKERAVSRLKGESVPDNYEIKIIKKNGEERWIELVNNRITIHGKKVILGTGIDITENKKAQAIQTVLYNISNAVNTTTEIEELYDIIHDQLHTIIDTTNFYIALYDKETNIITAPYYKDELKKTTPEPQQLKTGLTSYVIKNEKSLFLTVKKRKQLIKKGVVPDMNWKSKIWVGVPLKIRDTVIGALAIQSYSDAKTYTKDDLEVLEFVSAQIALAIDRKKAQDALKESIIRNQALLQAIPDMIFVLDKNGKYLDFEAEKNGLLAVPREQIIGKSIMDTGFNESQVKLILNKIEAAIQSGTVQTVEYELEVPEGLNTFEARIVPLNRNKILSIVRDVTNQRKAEQELVESEERYRKLFDASPDPIVVHSKGKLISGNKAAADFIGIDDAAALFGKPIIDFVAPECLEIVKERVQQLYTVGTPVELVEEKYITLDGTIKDVEVSAIPIIFRNEKAVLVAFRDITGRKRNEERIRNSLNEKEVMLQEIHHRVKNNMQVISSLLNLQARYIRDDKDLELFRDSINRVKSMALIHEKLYKSEDLARIDFSDYIHKLTRNLFIFFKIDINRVKYEIELEEILLDINKAIPCGLIINELLSNSLKYAFPGNKKGLIQIKIDHLEKENKYKVLYEDNGIGLPVEIDIRNTETLGIQLIITLVKQLHGKIELDKKNRSKYLIEFVDTYEE